jgi:hypothetical protein
MSLFLDIHVYFGGGLMIIFSSPQKNDYFFHKFRAYFIFHILVHILFPLLLLTLLLFFVNTLIYNF